MKRSIAPCGRSVVWTVLSLLLLTFQAAGPVWSAAEGEGAAKEEKKAEDKGAAKEEKKAEEEETPRFSLRGDISTGVRLLGGDRASSKFNEYREIPKGTYLQSLFLVGESKDFKRFLELRAKNVRQTDEFVQFRLGAYGRQQLKVKLDKTPHVFSNTGRLVFQESGRGVFTLADVVQTNLQTIATTDIDPGTPGTQIDTTAFGNVINGLVSPVDLQLQRRTNSFTWSATPTPDLTYSLSYSKEDRNGSRPFGTTFVFTNQNELPEPISHRTSEFKGSVEYGNKRGVALLEIKRSDFTNHVDALIWDNPIRLADHATLGPGHGQLTLPPDNEAKEISLSGVWHFSDRATFFGTLSRGKWTQNDDFLPFTVNTVLMPPALPATSLHGKIDTSLSDFNFNFAARPDLSVRVYHRRYENDNKTPQLDFPSYVRTDTSVVAGPFETEPVGFKQSNAGVDVAYNPNSRLNLKLILDRETWDRQHRDVTRTRDNRLGLSADYHVNSWLTARGALRQSKRRIKGDYIAEEPAQMPALRKFDEADLDRDEASFILQATPAEGRWDATLTFTRLHDDYLHSSYGLLNDRNNSFTVDVGYALSERCSLFVGYARERINWSMMSRFRTFAGTTLVDIPENDWSSDMRDRVNTYWLGVNSVLVPDKLDLELALSASSGKGSIMSAGAPGGDAAGEPSAFPDTSNKWFEPRIALRYRAGSNMSVILGYRMERYRETDFAQDTMMPYMPPPAMADAPTGTWLGARQPGYKAHIFTIAVERRF